MKGFKYDVSQHGNITDNNKKNIINIAKKYKNSNVFIRISSNKNLKLNKKWYYNESLPAVYAFKPNMILEKPNFELSIPDEFSINYALILKPKVKLNFITTKTSYGQIFSYFKNMLKFDELDSLAHVEIKKVLEETIRTKDLSFFEWVLKKNSDMDLIPLHTRSIDPDLRLKKGYPAYYVIIAAYIIARFSLTNPTTGRYNNRKVLIETVEILKDLNIDGVISDSYIAPILLETHEVAIFDRENLKIHDIIPIKSINEMKNIHTFESWCLQN